MIENINWEQIDTSNIVPAVTKLIANDVYPNTGVIMKRNYNEVGQVESVQILNEVHTIYKNRIVLNQIPETYYRVQIAGMAETIGDEQPLKGQYKVAYDAGIVFFSPNLEGETVTISQYYGCGVEMIPISRIYSDIELDGTITTTLYDIIKIGTDSIKALQEVGGVLVEGKKVSGELVTNTTNATTINNSLVTNIPKAQPLADNLNNSVENATKQLGTLTNLDNSLKNDINVGTPLNSSLETNIATAQSIVENIPKAVTTNKELETTIENASNLNSVIANASAIAGKLTTLGQTVTKNVIDIKENTFITTGGFNLVTGANFGTVGKQFVTKSSTCWNNFGNCDENLIKGRTYTITALVESPDTKWAMNIYTANSSSNPDQSLYLGAKEASGIITGTFICDQENQPYQVAFYNYGGSQEKYVKWFTVTEGDKAKSWIPSLKELNYNNNYSSEIASNKAAITTMLNQPLPSDNLIPFSDFRPLRGITSNEYGIAQRMTGIAVEEGKTYTLTVCGCISEELKKSGGFFLCDLYDANWSSNGTTIYGKTDTTPTVYSVTFTATLTEYLYISTYPHPQNGKSTNSNSATETATIYWYCLREGTQASNWVESPYEFGSGVNLFSNANMTSNEFNSYSKNGTTMGITDVELCEGVIYTLTVYAVNRGDCQNGTDAYFNSGYSNSNQLCPFIQFLDDNWKVKSVTFQCQKTAYYSIMAYDNATETEGVRVAWYTLTEGSKANAWTPSLKEMTGSDQLESLGYAVTQLDLTNNETSHKSDVLGQNTAQLMLKSNELDIQTKALGENTTNLMIKAQNLDDKSSSLGQNTVQLMLSNHQLQQQNEQLGEEIVKLILQNTKLQEQLETLGKVIIQTQLNTK